MGHYDFCFENEKIEQEKEKEKRNILLNEINEKIILLNNNDLYNVNLFIKNIEIINGFKYFIKNII